MEAILEHFFDELEATYLLALRETLEERTLKRAFLAWKALAIRRKSRKQRRKQITAEEATPPSRRSSLRKSLSKLFSKIDINTAIPTDEGGKKRALPPPQLPTRPVSTTAVVVVARRKSSLMRILSKRISMPPPPEPMQAASPALRPAPTPPPPTHLTYKLQVKDNDRSVFQLDIPNQNHHSNNHIRADGSSSSGMFHFRNSRATTNGENGRVSSQQDLLLQRSSSYRFSDYYRKQREQVDLLHNLKLKAEARKQERKKSKKQSALEA